MVTTRSLLEVWFRRREQQQEVDDLVAQTDLLRAIGRSGDSSLLQAQRDAVAPAISYERARLQNRNLRPREFLDRQQAEPGGGFLGGLRDFGGDILGRAGDIGGGILDLPAGRDITVGGQIGGAFSDLLDPGPGGRFVAEQAGRVPVIGEALEREAGALLTPAGLATLGQFPKFTALGALGGVGAGTAGEVAEDLGAPGGTGEVAQIAGNILAPGAGLVKAPRIRLPGRGVPPIALPETPADIAARKLTNVLQGAKRSGTQEALELARTRELGRRVGQAGRVRTQAIAAGQDPEKALLEARGQLAGKLPSAELDIIPRDVMNADDVQELFREIGTRSGLLELTRQRATEALQKVLAGELPQRGEVALLEKIFGQDLSSAIIKLRPRGIRELGGGLISSVNLVRAVQTAFDLSAPFRQGVLLIGHPKEFLGNMRPMVRAFFSENYSRQVEDMLSTGAAAERRARAKLYQAPFGSGAAGLAEREEAFMTRLTKWIPGLRNSERAYVTYLNKLRADVFDTNVAIWDRTGSTLKDELELARMLNIFSGRGELGPLQTWAPVMNQVLFAGRLLISRPQAIAFPLFTKSNKVRALAARDLLSFLGFGTSMLSLAAAGAQTFRKTTGREPDFSIELDPRSTDFMKIRVGSDRTDFWGGYQPLVRYMAQIITGQRKSAAGFVDDADRVSSMLRFLRSKLSPQAGFGTDVVLGETFLGDEVEPTTESIKTQAFNRLVPLFAQDMFDAIKEMGAFGAFLALPGALGASVQNYRTFSERVAATMNKDIEQGLLDVDSYGGIPASVGQLDEGDKQAFLERHPEIAEELAKFQERGLERGEAGSKLRQRTDRSRETLHADLDGILGSFRTQFLAGHETTKEGLDAFWTAFLGFRKERVGVIKDNEKEFAEVIAEFDKREILAPGKQARKVWFEVNQRHPDRFNDAQWEAYELDLARSMTPQQIALAREESGFDDHRLEQIYHALQASLQPYYDLPRDDETRRLRKPRQIWRRDNPEGEAALFLLGKIEKVKTSRAREIAVAWSQQLWGVAVPVEITRRR